MLLTLTTTWQPATDLGYLLHKHPDRVHRVELSFGPATVIYPEATADRCTAALVLDVDPVGLVRGRDEDQFALRPYVNDRPYVASSFLAVAIGQVFRTAMGARCDARPELVNTPIPLTVHLPAVVSSPTLLRRLFEPLGYQVEVGGDGAQDAEQEGAEAPASRWRPGDPVGVVSLTLTIVAPLFQVLHHLYVLIPVLDDEKHYYVGEEEVTKLLARGEGWLATHPSRELITRRYLSYRSRLTRLALSRLAGEDDTADADAVLTERDAGEAASEAPLRLQELRLKAVLEVLQQRGAARVVDLGCGEGQLLRLLLVDRRFTEIIGVDVSPRVLTIAERRLRLDQLPDGQRARIRLIQGSMLYRDERLVGVDAVALVEVIEHLEPGRLDALEDAVFATIRPPTVVVTTPNAEYNTLFPNLAGGRFRHGDHRFEWTRAELKAWAHGVASRHRYQVRIDEIGPLHPEHGAPTSMVSFTR